MKINELQIGDWVIPQIYDSRTEPSKIVGIHYNSYKGKDYADWVDCEVWDELSLDEVKPIPLTPEILEKIGFKKSDFFHVENKHQWFWWENAQTSIMLWCCSLDDDPKDGWMVRIEGESITLCMRVLFLHNLQHAMRMCGIEKEIEL